MRSYERRARGGVVTERVANIREGTWRDRELSGWVATRTGLHLEEGWYLVGDDLDDGTAGDMPAPGDHVEIAEILAAAEREARRQTTPPAAPPAEQAAEKPATRPRAPKER